MKARKARGKIAPASGWHDKGEERHIIVTQ
jgi:hypothetical protein